jgi:hypothetical protein
MRASILAIVFLLSVFSARAVDSFYGFSVGLGFSFGTHVNRIGLSASAYYNYGFAQANISTKGYYNIQSIGLKQKGFEYQFGAGMQFGFGRKDSARSPFINLTENNLLQDYSVGYTYLVYADQQKTKQASGILSVSALDFKFATHNDLFGFGQGWRDRYRTGAFLLEYRYQNCKFALNSTLWTDDYSICKKVLDSDYPARFGYKKANNCKFGGKSMGLFSLQFNYLVPTGIIPFSQNLQANLGIDSEKIRNVIQNKWIHDHYYVPKKWIKRNPCHIPMEARNGGQFLFQENQEIKKTSLYFNVGLNQGLFY